MRILIQALAGSIAIHVVYLLSELALGLVPTYFYQPEFGQNTVVLQHEIAFGYVVNYPYVGMTVTLVALALWLVLMIRDRKRKIEH